LFRYKIICQQNIPATIDFMGTTAPAEPTVDLIFLLQQAAHSLETEMAVRLTELGLSPRAYCVLSKALGTDRTQSVLAEQAALDKTTMVVTVDELEKTGLAERKPSSTDRRARIISVTPKGARVVAQANKIVADLYQDVLGELPDRDRTSFVGALDHLVGDRLATPLHTERPIRRRARKPQ
jgi:MarR family transcriptional regulator for hemolysin